MSNDQHSADQRAAIYASTPTDSMESVNDRLGVVRNNAEQVGFEVVAHYVDLRSENTQLLQMIADAAVPNPLFRKVMAVNLSRVSREIDELEQHAAHLVAHGVEIISASELALRALAPSTSDYFHSVHSEQVRRGIRSAAQQGFYAFANAPLYIGENHGEGGARQTVSLPGSRNRIVAGSPRRFLTAACTVVWGLTPYEQGQAGEDDA